MCSELAKVKNMILNEEIQKKSLGKISNFESLSGYSSSQNSVKNFEKLMKLPQENFQKSSMKKSEEDENPEEFIKFTNIKHLNSSMLRNTAEFGMLNLSNSPKVAKNSKEINELTSENLQKIFDDYKVNVLDRSRSSKNQNSLNNHSQTSPGENLNNSNFFEKYIQNVKKSLKEDEKSRCSKKILNSSKSSKRYEQTNNFDNFDEWCEENGLQKALF